MKKLILSVYGMSCGHCEIAVQDAIRKLHGIQKVKASKRKKEVSIDYEPAQVTPEQIIVTINGTGYSVIS